MSKAELKDEYMSNNTFDKPEKISRFFNERAAGYNKHMEQALESSFKKFYRLISAFISETKEKITVLELGCGTGLELEGIFTKAPNALVTGIDVSEKMLSNIRSKYVRFLEQIELIRGSYLTIPFQEKKYDYVVSVMAMHHLLHDTKRKLYEKISKAVKNGGKYIEGDYVVSKEKEQQFLMEYNKKIKGVKKCQNGTYHIDIPFSIKTQCQLLLEAGFSDVEVIWHENEAAIFVAGVK